jgi:transposase
VGRDLEGSRARRSATGCRQADRDEGRLHDGGLTSDERQRLVELERDKLRLEKENRILKAATAYFAKDQL